jgi:hypothetical protein
MERLRALPARPQQSFPDLDRSLDVWYEDGTIILRANDILFRVYKGILSSQSTVFKDLLSVPQPSDTPIYDGCPVVTVQDSSADLEPFLRALHEWDFTEQNHKFQTILSILSLGSKYCVDRLISWAVRPILYRFAPTTLEEYLSAADKSPFFDIRDLITLINLARRCDIPEILPVAFFEAAFVLETDQMFWGVSSGVASGSGAGSGEAGGGVVSFENHSDVKSCADGRLRMASAFSVQRIFPTSAPSTCRDPSFCNIVLQQSAASMQRMAIDSEESPGCLILPLKRIKTLVGDMKLNLCGQCMSDVQRRGQETMVSLWLRLPELFRLVSREEVDERYDRRRFELGYDRTLAHSRSYA